MQEIKDWIESNSLDVKWISELMFTLNGQDYLCVSPKQGKLFDSDFNLVIDEKEAENILADNYCFYFGGKVYYSSIKEEKIQLNILKHIGKAKGISGFPYLGIHGGYELCVGSRSYEDWCKKAKFLGIEIVGIAEKHTLAGALKFQQAAKKIGVKPIIGETITIKKEKEEYKVKIYVTNEMGWANLLRIHKRLNIDNLSSHVDEECLLNNSEGLICVFQADTMLSPELIERHLESKFTKEYFQFDPVEYKAENRDIYCLNCLKNYLNNYIDIVSMSLIPDSYYLDKEDSGVKKILTFIGKATFEYQSEDQYFKSLEDIAGQSIALFESKGEEFALNILESAINGTNEIAELCNFQIKTGEIHLPKYEMTKEEKKQFKDNEELFWSVIEEGLQKKVIDKGVYSDIYLERIEKETKVILGSSLGDYFLILYDIIKWCKDNGILTGVGRGSAAGSLVSFCMGITDADPIEYGLLFERFINSGRLPTLVVNGNEKKLIGGSMMDVDVDVTSLGRDSVKRYIENRYGVNNVCSIGTYSTLQSKAALRDLLRFHGESPQNINYFSGMIEDSNEDYSSIFHATVGNEKLKIFLNEHLEATQDIPLILGQAKSSSIHASGIIITPKDDGKEIFDWFPCKMMNGVVISEWEGSQLDESGFLKEDILGLSQLDKFVDILKLINENGTNLKIEDIDLHDKSVFELFKKGYNQDTFQFGTDGLTAYSREVKPDSISELAAINALYRPGPMESGAHTDYVKIKWGKKQPEYDFGTEEITKETYSLMIYQEEVMEVCVKLGGFTLVEADDIRKAMGKKIEEKLQSYMQRFIEGAKKNGCPENEAYIIWNKLVAFAGYGFNKCISGDERFYKSGMGRFPFKPTIREYYKIRTSSSYAKLIKKKPLHSKLKRVGYGSSFSLDERDRLVINKIKDIRYEGIQDIYRVTTESNKKIDVTLNHKFPTNNGIKMVSELKIGEDQLIINSGYKQDPCSYIWNLEGNNLPKKGQMGFQTRDTAYTRFIKLREELIEQYKICQQCSKDHRRLEVHHKDGNHGNSDPDNLVVLCPSCHKKEEYKLGRMKMGRKGLMISFEHIKSIEFLKKGDVYDIEMNSPYHSFSTANKIVTCNSHAVAYAMTGYICQWFKKHYPLEFWTISLQYSSDDEIPKRVAEMRKFEGLNLHSPDINKSKSSFHTEWETDSIYWSIGRIKHVGEVALKHIEEERKERGDFFSLEEFVQRCKSQAVNSRVVKHLIYSGCFDKLHNIEHPLQRKKLMEEFANLYGLDVDLPDESNKEFYWYKLQRNLSGYGYFDYSVEVDDLGFDYNKYVTADQIQMTENVDCNVVVGGLMTEFVIRKTKKGEMAKLTVDHNNDLIDVVLWNDTFEQVREQIEKGVGSGIMLNGKIQYDGYNKKNVVYSNEKTCIEIF